MEWVTYQQNAQHAWDTGLQIVTDRMRENDRILGRNVGIKWAPFNKGEMHGRSKLTEKQILEIKNLYNTGSYFQKELAEMFNISQTQISKILLSQSWEHLNLNIDIINQKKKRGALCKNAKLSDEKVKEILLLGKTKKYLQKELAEMFNVSKGVINGILVNRIWKHIPRDVIKGTY